MTNVRKTMTTTITGTGSGPKVGELLATLRGLPEEATVRLQVNPSREQREPSTWTVTVTVEGSISETMNQPMLQYPPGVRGVDPYGSR